MASSLRPKRGRLDAPWDVHRTRDRNHSITDGTVRSANNERTDDDRRTGLLLSLAADRGVTEAEQLIAAWERHAAHAGIDRSRRDFWKIAGQWVHDACRKDRHGRPSEPTTADPYWRDARADQDRLDAALHDVLVGDGIAPEPALEDVAEWRGVAEQRRLTERPDYVTRGRRWAVARRRAP